MDRMLPCAEMLGPRVFLVSEGFPPTVLDGQVVDLLRALAAAGKTFDLVDFDPLLPKTLATRAGRERVARFRAALPGRLVVRPFVPYEDRAGAPLATAQLRRLLRGGPRLVHARGLVSAWLAAKAAPRGVALVYDARGDAVAEHRFHHGGHGASAVSVERILRMEGEVLARCERVFAVSQALVDALAARHPGVAGKARVFPCACDGERFRPDPAARERWRKELGLEGRWVLVYSGSLVPYQLPERVAALARLAATSRQDAHLLLLTPDAGRAQDLLRAAELPRERWTVRAATHAEMPGLLAAADVGVLLRRNDPVNAAASPTKLAEYLACGLPLLVSAGVGDLSAQVAREGLGAVVQDPDDDKALVDALERLLTAPPPPERVATWAREHLTRDRFVPRYLEEYASLGA